jgi:hypothetical protein
MNSGFAGRFKEVESALLDYQRTPGKYSLLLRRPPILFSSIKEVLLLASGRLPEGAPAPSLAIQRAAGFFVRTALLYPAADHYALLGLDRSADAAAIKERYRQMMRLTHPDFASSAAASGNWPADAAARINEAYEVLASDARRRSYDEKLNPTAAPAPHRSPSNHSLAHARATASAPAPDPRRLLKRMAGAFGVLGVIVLAASLLARGPDRDSLVQRDTPRKQRVAPVVAQRDAAPLQADAVQGAKPSAELAPAVDNAPSPAAEAPAMLNQTPSVPRARPAGISVAAATEPARVIAVSADTMSTPVISAQPPAAPTPAPSNSMASVPAVVSSVAPAPIQRVTPTIVPAVTMAEAHALIAALLQQMESGSGERLLNGLDRNARSAAGAQALARQYAGLVEGARSVKVSNVLLKGDPREDRLLVKGQVLLEIADFTVSRSRELSLEAEFSKRNGAIVMTRLSPGQAQASQ